MDPLAKLALEEYNSDVTTAHHGGAAGRPFWNAWASQFMFNPCFQFSVLPGCETYRFTAKDESGKEYTFDADSPTSLLTPIWGDLPEGFIELRVEALDKTGKPVSLVGARTFYRLAPFAGRGAYPPAARSYRECARMAYHYAYSQPFIQHWLLHGTPDPDYDFNVYPSRTIESVVRSMIRYAQLDPDNAENAIKLACRAADFLISISYPADSPLPGLPPTYYLNFRMHDLSAYNNETAEERIDQIMMFLPAGVGRAYLMLEQATGESRYLEAALAIARYYRDHVQENGSFELIRSVKTGEPLTQNYCVPDGIMDFFNKLYARTGDPTWHKLELGCYNYLIENCLKPYNWEGQFEDSAVSVHYSNLTHFGADAMIAYITNNMADNPAAMEEAEDLMRFVEDQFVVWGKISPRNRHMHPKQGDDMSQWFSPSGLEQYHWYMPIDSSTAYIMDAFIQLYKVTKRPLLLAKARVLGDAITRMQNSRTGMIPTHWMRHSCIEDGGNLWINCLFMTADMMFNLAEITEAEEK